MNQSSDSGKGKKRRGIGRDEGASGKSAPAPRVEQAASVNETDVDVGRQGEGADLGSPSHATVSQVQLDPMQLASLGDLIKSSMDQIVDARLRSIAGAADGERQSAAERDPSLDKNPLREEYRKNIEAHRNKRKIAFIAGASTSGVFFVLLIAFILRLLFSDFLLRVIAVAANSWQWHVLVFLGVTLALLAAIPLSLAMALMKMISDKDSSGADGGDMKAPGIELAKAIIDLCKNITAAISK